MRAAVPGALTSAYGGEGARRLRRDGGRNAGRLDPRIWGRKRPGASRCVTPGALTSNTDVKRRPAIPRERCATVVDGRRLATRRPYTAARHPSPPPYVPQLT